MTKAPQVYSKNARETKSVLIDCAGVLATGETIATPGTPVIVKTPASAAAVVVTGTAKTSTTRAEPGRPVVAVGRGLEAYISGGAAGAVYEVTFPFTTSGGQDLDATISIRVL